MALELTDTPSPPAGPDAAGRSRSSRAAGGQPGVASGTGAAAGAPRAASRAPSQAAGRAAAGSSRQPGRRTRRLGRWAHRTLLTTHILASVGWFGLAITVAFCGVLGTSRGDLAFYEVIDATLALSVPLGLGAAATGVALSLTTRWGLVRHWWVVAKEAATVAVILTDVLVVGPEMQEAIDMSTITGMPSPVYAHCVVLGLATVLSVFKPKARTPFGSRRERAAAA